MDRERLGRIRLLFLDVDGVLTDGHIWLDGSGREMKGFHVRDGLGIRMLIEAGIEVAIVTGRRSEAVAARAAELGVCRLYQGVKDKQALCERVRGELGLAREMVACIGDDLPDLDMFAAAGFRIAVADAAEEVHWAADARTAASGGHGAVREVCEWLLKAQEKWGRPAGGPAAGAENRLYRGSGPLI